MELQAPIPFPPAADAASEAADHAVLTEVDVAIALVASRIATRVRVASLDLVVAERLAGLAAARAGSSGLRFVVERSADRATFTVGPIA
jgi:hypothetical protein